MTAAVLDFDRWLADAAVPQATLTAAQRAVLQAAFAFLQRCGHDYYSVRLLSHFLLHCQAGLAVAHIARLVRLSRSAASAQQGLSSKEVVQAAHHRLRGRSHGKLLPRFAGPIAHFLHQHPDATRWDLLDFIRDTLGVSVSRMALHHFLKKYGLDGSGPVVTVPKPSAAAPAEPTIPPPPPAPPTGPGAAADRDGPIRAQAAAPPPGAQPLPPAEFFAPTRYAGAFLLLPTALEWLACAEDCFEDAYGSLRRGLLTSAFAPVVGLQRLFHLEQMDDRGFALLTGGLSCPSRQLVGGWRRHLRWYEVDAFCRRTCPWDLVVGDDALVSFDEHTIPRWTHKFSLRKGYVTTRNKYMRCEKLFYGYHVEMDRYLCVRGTPGHVELRDLALPLVQRVLTCGRPRQLHALFDAGAGKSDADVRALLDLAAQTPNLMVTLRACRYPHRMRVWKQLPSGLFTPYKEPGAYVGAPSKEIRLAETRTILKGESAEQAVRTILCREVVPGPKKDRWHPLFTSSTAEQLSVLLAFRLRQHHEQGYRVGVYDEFLDSVPCGYDKDSPDPQRPRFHRGPLQMIGWLLALVYNAVADLSSWLPERFVGAHVGTLRRTFLERPGQLYCTPESLIVYLDPFRGQEALVPLIDFVNGQQCRIPWLENRRLVLSLAPSSPGRRSGP